jgi:hypothetical protein
MKIQDIEKKKRTERVIQFGEGGFLRGFFDWMLHKINAATDFNGSAVVVQPIENGTCDLLSEQNCLYTHIIRGAEGVEREVIDVISRCVKPYENFEEYLSLADLPDILANMYFFILTDPLNRCHNASIWTVFGPLLNSMVGFDLEGTEFGPLLVHCKKGRGRSIDGKH